MPLTDQQLTDLRRQVETARSHNYSDAQIQQFLSSRYDPTDLGQILAPSVTTGSGIMPALERIGETGGRALAAGLGLPGDLERLAVQGANWLAPHLGLSADTGSDPDAFLFPSSAMTSQLANFLPVPGPSRSTAETLTRAGIGGIAGALPVAVLTGGLGELAPALRTAALAGLAGGEAGEGAKLLGGSEPLQIGAGVAASGVAGLRAGRSIADVAAGLGKSKDLASAGNELQDALENWRNAMPAKEAAAESLLVNAVPADAEHIPAETVTRAVEMIQAGGQGANAVRQFLGSTVKSGGALGNIAKQIQSGVNSELLEPGAVLPSLTFAEGRKFRTELGSYGAATHDPVAKSAMDYLYGGATADLGTTAARAGADDEFSAFNAEVSRLHDFDSRIATPILDAKGPHQAALRALNPDVLPQLRSEVPDATNELAAAHLNVDPTGKAFSRFPPTSQVSLIPDQADRNLVTGGAASTPIITVPRLLETLASESFGGPTIGLGLSSLGVSDPRVARMIGEAISSGLPWLVPGARALAQNPLAPIAGGAAAGYEQRP